MAEVEKKGPLHTHLQNHFGTDTSFKTEEIYLGPGALKITCEFTLGLKDSAASQGNSPLAKQILEINASKDQDFKYRLGIYQGKSTKMKVWISHNPTSESKDLMIALQRVVAEGIGTGIQMVANKGLITAADSRSIVGVLNISISEPLGSEDDKKFYQAELNSTDNKARIAANQDPLLTPIASAEEILEKSLDPNDPAIRRKVHKHVRELVNSVLTEFASGTMLTFENMNDLFTQSGTDYIQ